MSELENKMTKQDFDELYVGEKLVVNCRSEEEANEFLKLADSFGYKWRNEDSYLYTNNWDTYEEDTCYHIYDGTYTSLDYFTKYNYKIVEYGENKMTHLKHIKYIPSEKENKMTINELRDIIIENFKNKQGNVEISGLDFSNFDGYIDIGGMRVKGNLHQSGHRVEGDLFQSRHEVKGEIFEGNHKKLLTKINAEELANLGYEYED